MAEMREPPDETDEPTRAPDDQDEVARESRDTGGDAEAAASIAEREAVARGDDELFEGEETGSGDTERPAEP